MEKTIGGDRLGSGQKMTVDLHAYNRSTHNLSENFISTMPCGVLVPTYVNIGLNGDTFDIDLDSIVRTLPTLGPLFGSFKFQVDCFKVPLRLYNNVLHNNPINVGMNMQNILFPRLIIRHNMAKDFGHDTNRQIHPSSLVKFLGISGLGNVSDNGLPKNLEVLSNFSRSFFGVPALAYFDIFKNYYANKQETHCYQIYPAVTEQDVNITGIVFGGNMIQNKGYELPFVPVSGSNQHKAEITAKVLSDLNIAEVTIGEANAYFDIQGWPPYPKYLNFSNGVDELSFDSLVQQGYLLQKGDFGNRVYFTGQFIVLLRNLLSAGVTPYLYYNDQTAPDYFLRYDKFPLSNIDDARKIILSKDVINIGYVNDPSEDDLNFPPYDTISHQALGYTQNMFPLNGLMLKTYQSDLFNNWIQTDWIDGDNGIAAITRVDTSDGLNLDALNLAQKVYNMLNRIAVSGGTYEDWQEAVYGQQVLKRAETPVYCGGMSSEIVFQEVVSNADTDVQGDFQRLGSLAGKGTLVGKKGGSINIHIDEPSLIMCIASITPRVSYSQGNKWYMTELISYNDLHKPELDGIGFQNLMGEQLAWFDTHIDSSTGVAKLQRSVVGKVPAWINYMTGVDHIYGSFADPSQQQFMVLDRSYSEQFTNSETGIADVTTYIDPAKFSYPFAYASLENQNFWVQISHKVIARRVMSAKIIPNL